MKGSLLILLVAMTTLSGCLGGDAAEKPRSDTPTTPAPETDGGDEASSTTATAGGRNNPAEPTETTVVAGSLTWHSTETQGIALPIVLASQPVFNECVSAEGDIGNGNLDLRRGDVSEPVPNGTHALQVVLSWEQTDYHKDRLVLAYQPGGQAIQESDWIQNGEAASLQVDGEPNGGEWGLWGCVSRSGATTNTDSSEGPKPFIGDLAFEVVAFSR